MSFLDINGTKSLTLLGVGEQKVKLTKTCCMPDQACKNILFYMASHYS